MHTCTFSISHYFPCMSHLLHQRVCQPHLPLHISNPTTRNKPEQALNNHSIPHMLGNNVLSAVTLTQSSCPTNTTYFKNISRENKQAKQRWKRVGQAVLGTQSENTTCMILLDKETTSARIMPTSIFLLK